MKQGKGGLHPAVKVALFSTALTAIVGTILLKVFPIEISISSGTPNTVPVIKTANSPPADSVTPPKAEKPDPTALAARQGNLRIRNQSDHAVRVALLARQPKEPSAKSSDPQKGFALPAHWDFAPQEGSESGLLVALPSRSIQLKRGDVLVAFAQDGSQRYWGPFVVGETDQPDWNAQAGEWELALDN
ncbi:hypothetical protein [Leptolyngbya sp. FACHB-17]|uniref:hypothetical protein n=1 Tax=unclassified Leptolyngbya TaxID=2650499 RepID=UPI0016810BE3|nr:hypothetical protein [Leptolyngbya sp. FACHB-17]MBD2082969.1 hypothetical protein [Leptolyngbya sp. FACHB-17]